MNKKFLKLLIFVSASFVLYVTFEILSLTQKFQAKEELDVELSSSCNLQRQDCLIDLNGYKGTISISPRPFYLNQKIKISVQFDSWSSSNLSLDLVGIDMDMGFNRYILDREQGHLYTKEFILPTCTKDYMGWKLVLFSNKKANVFQFLSEKK